MYKWLCVNKLSFNIATTNYILVGRHTHQHNVAIIINDVTIQRVQATTFLGVVIDESLNWKNHINFVRFMYESGWIVIGEAVVNDDGVVGQNQKSLCLYSL